MDTKQATACETAPKFKELFEFVLANKGVKTFRGYSDGQIAQMLYDGLVNQSLYYEQGLDGRLVGMILASVCSEKKTIWVDENLAMSKETLSRFAMKAKSMFPDYSIGAQRHGRDVYFDTTKLYNKLG